MIIFVAVTLSAQGCADSVPSSRARWEMEQGGLVSSGQHGLLLRAQSVLARVESGCGTLPLHIAVLTNDAPVAHSFRDGSLYVSTGLMRQFTDEELAAALAHELGHLVIDGLVSPEPAALAGVALQTDDVELHADLLARNILHAHGLPPAALTTALEKVAAASRHESFYQPLVRRMKTLQTLDAQAR